ncbi:MAG: sodium/proline symporter [Myxococcota bacterium]
MVVVTFLVFLGAFTAVGVASLRKRQDTTEDYLVASRSVHPWLAALSSVATNNSGFMFIGLIGFAYEEGLKAVWLQAGWLTGDLLLWLKAHRRVRERSEQVQVASVPALIAADNDGTIDRVVAAVAGLITLFFLAGYAAAQLNAGSTALHSLFDWPMSVGALLGAAIVVAYSFSGGVRASIWTDAAQSIVMLVAIVALVVAAMNVVPLSELPAQLHALDPTLVQWAPEDLTYGLALYFLGWVFAGLGAIGQPHILVRTMAIDAPENIGRARFVYMLWFVPFSVAVVLVGLYARAIIPDLQALADAQTVAAAELALPELATRLLPEFLVGVCLAGLFAATMSTADSQLLACSAAVTQDIAPRWRNSYLASKVATLVVAAVALVFALTADEGVFALVLNAWSALGATLGPVLIVRLAGGRVPRFVALAMMLGGLVVVSVWSSDAVYKLLPGMLVPLAIYGAAWGTGLVRRGSSS